VSSKHAMITIEVLVSMLILFLVIATSFENIKFFTIMTDKKAEYEENYMNVLSLKDKLSSTICKTHQSQSGEFNAYKYEARCEKVKELRSFSKGFEIGDPSGNFGNYNMKLYKVTLLLKQDNREKLFQYYLTIGEKITDD